MTFLSPEEQLNVIRSNAVEIIPEKELLQKLESSRRSGTPLNIKLGCDPSRPDLHIGHAVVLRKLRQFQDLGHQAILVIGDFTAMIGDPSGRNKTRPQLSLQEAKSNAKSYVEQSKVILDIKKLKIVYNSDWLNEMNFSDVIKLASKYTVARMLERDDFTNRYKSEIPISIHEFLYPLAQGMDSVELQADVEIGGTDQKFNLLVGRDLQREYNQAPQAILTLPLLEGTDGVEKMSKSYGNDISLQDQPDEMYGKTLSLPDELISKYFSLAIGVSDKRIDEIESQLKDGQENPRDLKRELARELVSLYHSKQQAQEAEKNFDKIFIQKEIPDEIEEYNVTEEKQLLDILVEIGLIKSKGEGRRLVKQNAIKINGIVCTDELQHFKPGDEENIVKVGKRRFLKVIG